MGAYGGMGDLRAARRRVTVTGVLDGDTDQREASGGAAEAGEAPGEAGQTSHEITASIAQSVELGYHLGGAVERILSAAAGEGHEERRLREAVWLVEDYLVSAGRPHAPRSPAPLEAVLPLPVPTGHGKGVHEAAPPPSPHDDGPPSSPEHLPSLLDEIVLTAVRVLLTVAGIAAVVVVITLAAELR